MTRVIWRCTWLVAALVGLAVSAGAQQIATEQNRREALQFYRIGQELLSGEQFEKAAEQFAKAVQRDQLLTVAHYGLGQSYMGLRRYATAAKAYRDCLEAFKTLHGLEQSHRFEVERQRDDEIKALNENIRSLTQAGQTLRATQAEARVRDLERQKTSMEAAFQAPAEVLLSLGSALFRNGDAAAAMTQWEAAIVSNPKLGEDHNNLAVVYMEAGRFADAERELKLAEKNGFRVNPQFKDDLKARAKAERPR
jgi:tetratricopeptide (TPR) repeat protein